MEGINASVACSLKFVLLAFIVCVHIQSLQANPIWSKRFSDFGSLNSDGGDDRSMSRVRRMAYLLDGDEATDFQKKSMSDSLKNELIEKYALSRQASRHAPSGIAQKREGPTGLDMMCIWKVC